MRSDNAKPRAFDLSSKEERLRLIRETRGYLHTCRREHHGMDWDGRAFAIEAFESLSETALIPPQADREAVRDAVKAMREAREHLILIRDHVIKDPLTKTGMIVVNLTAAIAKLGEE